MRAARFVQGVAALAVASGACATFGARPSAVLALECRVGEATVLVDDVLTGRCAEWKPPGRRLVAGFHRIEVRHLDHHSFFAEVTLEDGQARVLPVELRPELD